MHERKTAEKPVLRDALTAPARLHDCGDRRVYDHRLYEQEPFKMSTQRPIPMTTAPKLLTETQVSESLNVSLSTLRYWRQCGVGPTYVKLERLVRYDAAALRSYIQRNLRVSAARATAEEKRVAR